MCGEKFISQVSDDCLSFILKFIYFEIWLAAFLFLFVIFHFIVHEIIPPIIFFLRNNLPVWWLGWQSWPGWSLGISSTFARVDMPFKKYSRGSNSTLTLTFEKKFLFLFPHLYVLYKILIHFLSIFKLSASTVLCFIKILRY